MCSHKNITEQEASATEFFRHSREESCCSKVIRAKGEAECGTEVMDVAFFELVIRFEAIECFKESAGWVGRREELRWIPHPEERIALCRAQPELRGGNKAVRVYGGSANGGCSLGIASLSAVLG